jgi:glycerophosphoryl diester phosphodiesterase
MVAFNHAIEIGSDWIELDVHTTADGVVIVHHDTTVDRCTDGQGTIRNMTLEEIKRLDAGIHMGDQFRGERIPTFEQTLDAIGDGRIRLCVEIKGASTDDYIRTAHATVQILQRRGFLRHAVIASFNTACLRAVKGWEPLLATSLDPTPQDGTLTPWELCQQLLACGGNGLQHWHGTLTAEIVEEAHHHGVCLWAWTTNEEADMRRVMDLGVDAIMTDYPDVLRRIVDEL